MGEIGWWKKYIYCFELADHKSCQFSVSMTQISVEFNMVHVVSTRDVHCQQYSLISLSAPLVLALNSTYPSNVIMWSVWSQTQASGCICAALYVLYACAYEPASYPKQLCVPQIGLETAVWPWESNIWKTGEHKKKQTGKWYPLCFSLDMMTEFSYSFKTLFLVLF